MTEIIDMPVSRTFSIGNDEVFGIAVYRLYDKNSTLLYVGVTNDLRIRLKQHEFSKSWWGEIDNVTAVYLNDRTAAYLDEAVAIRDEHPKYNVHPGQGASRLVPPSSGSRRVWFGARLFTPDENAMVEGLAAEETGGNLSAMVRRLVLEALAARALLSRNEETTDENAST